MAAQVHGVLGPVELLPGGQDLPRRLAVLAYLGRLAVLANGRSVNGLDVALHRVLGDHHQGAHEHTAWRQEVDQGVVRIPPPGLPGHLPDRGAPAQAIDRQAAQGGRAEPPALVVLVTARVIIEQGFREPIPVGQRLVVAAGFPHKGLQVAAKQVRAVVEKPQQPVVEFSATQPPHLNPGGLQGMGELVHRIGQIQ